MNPQFDLSDLRQLYIAQPEPTSVRILALTLCTAFLVAVLVLVRRGKLREEYTPIWTSVAVATMIATVWFDVVRLLTRLVGAWTPSSTPSSSDCSSCWWSLSTTPSGSPG
jgi:hypothetical protein